MIQEAIVPLYGLLGYLVLRNKTIHFQFSCNRILSSIRNDSLVYSALFSIFLDNLSEVKRPS